MTKCVKKELEKTSHILRMVDIWMGSEDGSHLTENEKKLLKELLKTYPLLRAIYNAGDFSGCVVNGEGKHTWDWTEEDWKRDD